MSPHRPGTVIFLWMMLFGLLTFGTGELRAQDEPTLEAGQELVQNGEQEVEEELGIVGTINEALGGTLGRVSGVIFDVLLFSIIPTDSDDPDHPGFPFVVAVMIFGAVLFTLYLKFVNITGFWHGFNVVRGKYDRAEDTGELTHFRALTTALSATVGLGNIAGVAIAISLGGPGAVFWMTIAGFFGMAAKFTECTLGQMYRHVNPDGSISGGPMYYLSRGLKERGAAFAALGKALAIFFAFFVICASFGGGNMFQANQSWEAVQFTYGIDPDNQLAKTGFGALLCLMVGIVVIGGIRRIGAATARIVPLMAALYFVTALVILVLHIREIPAAFETIVTSAFTAEGISGGVVGVLIQGVRRAAFSSEAGLGSAAIAHSAARTNEPVREGYVALLEPFIDTIVICNMTALVIVVTGVYTATPAEASGLSEGVILTKQAFETIIPWFPNILAVCVVLFAYSTMLAWCYYGERGWIYLLDHFGEGHGLRTIIVYRILFVLFVYLGVVASIDAIVDFSDAMMLSMAVPNIVGCILLLPILKKKVNDYWGRHRRGEMKPVR